MKNKNDHYKISNKIILDNWNVTGNILLRIINKSLETGVFPNNWKETIVSPIEKVQNTTKCEEFRPVNTLKTCEKILEKVVKDQLDEYIKQNKLLSKFQSGFRKNYSCETTVNYVISRLKMNDSGRKCIAIFLDFKRAFETLDRQIMLEKLLLYGVKETELKWFKSYLEDRKQVTKVNGSVSDEIKNDFGVPQGSILGALLFIIYINDMPNVLQKCDIVLYADDTLIYTIGDNDDECRNNLSHDMNRIDKWLKMNKLKLNEMKTKIMEINNTDSGDFIINNTKIEKVDHIKYLGFVIDKKLKMNEHVDYICKKIGKKLGFLRRIRNRISKETMINVYNTIVKPHFEYGSTILYTCCNNTQRQRMQKLQNKAMRIILKYDRYSHIQNMLRELSWMTIEQRFQFATLKFVKKMKEGDAPEYLCEQLRYVAETQPYHLRNADNFYIQRVSSTQMQRTLFYRGLKLFNALPRNIKNEENYNVFTKKCINFVKFSTNIVNL